MLIPIPTRLIATLVCCFAGLTSFAVASDAPANSELVVDESFDEPLSDDWQVNKGKWTVGDGVLRVSEISAEKHSAASRRKVESRNAVYQVRFRFVGDGKAIHLGFDPAPGELEKRGHLFSVIVTPESWSIRKHADKKRPKEDPNETLDERPTEFVKDRWYTLRVSTWGPYVTARVDGKDPLNASHPTFGVKKPTVVFRCLGDGVELDDLQVWRQLGSVN